MKKTRNIFIIVAVALMFAGIIICAVSFSMSGFNFSEFSTSLVGKEVKEMKADFKNEFSNLTLNTVDRKIDFQKSDDDMIHFEYTENEKRKIEISESNGTLSLTEHTHYKWYDYFFSFDNGNKLTVKLPAEINASISVDNRNGKITFSGINVKDDVKLHTSNGEISFSDDEIEGELIAQISNGRVNISNLDVKGNVELKTSNGEVSLQDFDSSSRLNIKTSNGKVYLNKAEAEEISMESSNGKIEFWDTDVTKSISAKTINGKIEGTLIGKEGDYNITAETSSNNSCNLPMTGNGGKTAYFKTSNGNIEVSYVQ
ncbi:MULTISPECIES: DUF4097 family beta strand repeat-containing protein [unclassified Ruminococcus]|uniref:DUF4097 family beta strand repeat-containing protein n=1 Tax=unclassified Ruminococcus TaxID=2608920 RepID=UPI00210A5DFF|nr:MULTISPECIES: DUF4097 family beta strand repeat-containing protein [unclassified Ruminococcus]MCQ4021544.1 DUF4097 family beta strand repeat protein [Ruminococcus sp. zg-924]MCQ4113989.1 DUF4097 family beta strand repeat protein [Ruminococcus sp. zg-921]